MLSNLTNQAQQKICRLLRASPARMERPVRFWCKAKSLFPTHDLLDWETLCGAIV